MPGVAGRSGGHNAKTTADHRLAGTHRNDRHGDYESPNPPKIKPDPPKELSGDALAEWDLMLGRLELSGTLTLVDDAVIYQYCKLYAETEAIAEQQEEARAGLRVLEENLPTRPETPEERLSAEDRLHLFDQIVALHKIISKCTDQLRAGRVAIRGFLVDLGQTPTGRGRVKIPKRDEKPTSKWEGALK